MADRDLIAFVRARIDGIDMGQRVPGVTDHLANALDAIVDEYERVSEYCAESNEEVHHGHKMGLEHAVVALADIWRTHPDWRAGWWESPE